MRPLGMESANLLLHTLPRGLDSGARATGVAAGSGESLRVAAGEFETLIVQKMLEAMRATVGKSGLLEQSAHRKVLEGSFDRQMAEHLVREGGGLGLAEQLHQASESRAGDTRVMPVEGRITSGFGSRRDPISGAHRFHGGVDLAAPAGTPIRAAEAGEVIFSGRRGAAGNLVMIRHDDGSVARYAHARELGVQRGARVAAGQEIATVGSTGRSTGPHLHFSVTEGERRLDPLEWLGGHGHAHVAMNSNTAQGGAGTVDTSSDQNA